MAKPKEIIELQRFYGIAIEEVTMDDFEFKTRESTKRAVFTRGPEGTIQGLILREQDIKDVFPLACLTALTQLDLFNNRVADLSPLASLTALTQLYLNSNQVADVSPLASLTALNQLYLNLNQVANLSPLASLTALNQLYLNSNQVADVSPLASLTALTQLNLSGNKVADVSPLASLTALTQLNLSYNQVSDLSPLASLTALTQLNLVENQVADLSPLLPLFKGQLTSLRLSNNPLLRPPLEIAEKGTKAMVAWFDSEQAGSIQLREIKVLLVGAGGAGKTSLIRSLTGEPFNPNQAQTPGIVVTNKTFACPGDVSVTAHLWDFGGQEIMHATHQFFLSRRSLYLLVLNSRIDDGSEEYWLKLIASFGGDSPILVVFSQLDQNPGFDLNRRALQEKYPHIQGFYPLSNKYGVGIAALQKAITAILPGLELVQTTWPRSWFNIKKTLETMPEPYIDYPRFRELCRKQGVVAENFQDHLLDYLHELGVALHFPDLKWLNTQVLKPEWVTEPVYALINHPAVAKAHGLVRYQDLPKLLPHFPADRLSFLGQLMAKFEICHPIEPNQLLFPDLLPKSKPELPFDESTTLRLQIHYHFLPRAVLPRLMVRLYHDIQHHDQGRYQWREGVLFHHPELNSQALVQVDYEQRQLSIQTNGTHRRDYLATVQRILRDIHESYHQIEAKEQIRCLCSECKDNKNPYLFAYEALLTRESKGKTTASCDKSAEDVPIRELLEGVFGPQEVMLIAAPADHPWRERLRKQLEAVNQAEVLAIWDETDIKPGQNQGEETDAALARARAVVVLVSTDFYQDATLRRFQEKLEKRRQTGLPIHWVPISPVTKGHAFEAYEPLSRNAKPLSLLTKPEAEQTLARIAENLIELLNKPQTQQKKNKPRPVIRPPVEAPNQSWFSKIITRLRN